MLKQSLPYIIALVILVLLFSWLGYSSFNRNNQAKNILAEKENTLQQIYSTGNLPSDELIDTMGKDNKELKDKYAKLKEKLPIAKEISLPEGVNLPLVFLQQLKDVKERVRNKAKEKGIEILTEDLGLPNTLPSNTEAPQLIKNLQLTEMILNLLLDVGVNSMDEIQLGQIQKTDMYEDITLILHTKCDILSLAKLLFTLENTDEGFFIVRGFSLTSIIVPKEPNVSSDITMDERAGMSRNQTRPGTRIVSGTESKGEKRVQVDLELSLIRWR